MRAVWVIACAMVKELIRKKDFYVLLILMLVLMGALSSQSFFQVEGVSRYVRDFGYSLVMLFGFIIAVTFSAKQLPLEIESKTIYPLLAKPLSRYTVILGKFTGGCAVSFISFSLFFASFGFFYAMGGEKGSLILLLQAFLFGALFLMLVSAFVIFLSNFVTVGANITLSFLMYIIIGGFADTLRSAVLEAKGLASILPGMIYYILPHFDFYDLRIRITHSWDPLPAWVVASVAAYTLVYSFFLLYFAGAIFRRKKL